MRSQQAIWVLEDDPGCQFVYREILDVRYQVRIFDTLVDFREALASGVAPDLVIADLKLKDGNFLNYLGENEASPCLLGRFIIVSSMNDLDVLRACFDEGAVDFLTKPFKSAELIVKLERIFANRDRAAEPREKVESKGVVDPSSLTIKVGDRSVAQLTAKELQIFSLLNESPERCMSRKDLIGLVWQKTTVSDKTLDVHLFNLRRKLAPVGMKISFKAPNSFHLVY